MIKDSWKQIIENQDVRQNLSKIRQELKNKETLNKFAALLKGQEQSLIALLKSEDAKIRKNAALLMGDLGLQEFLSPVFNAYKREEQRFVRSSYLSAIGNFDYREYLQELKDCMEKLSAQEVTEENKKHHMEELRELSALILRMEGVKKHRFTGWDKPCNIVLLTNRNFAGLTMEELLKLEPDAKVKVFGAGVLGQVKNLRWADKIRTYQELLFSVKGLETSPMDAFKLAEQIAGSELLTWLSDRHDGEMPYYFRIELKSKRPLNEKSAFVKKLSGQIEHLSERKLTNSVENYEIEIRVIENKEGNCNLLLKLFTLKDERFLYRKEVTPLSIRPMNAALCVTLAKEYLKEDAQVLDPFCGVGTMLLERHKAVRMNTAYGLDIQEDAIQKARRNTEAAGQIVHYINRDFFRFEHEYLFDEVITNMPFQFGRTTQEEIDDIYKRFFGTVASFLKEEALIILYSHDRELVEKLAARNHFSILKKYEISMREGTYVFLMSTIPAGKRRE